MTEDDDLEIGRLPTVVDFTLRRPKAAPNHPPRASLATKVPPGMMRVPRDGEGGAAFFIDLRPVSNADYAAFIDATGRLPPTTWPDGDFPDDRADAPVLGLTYSEALGFATWAKKRLPTDTEWERAQLAGYGLEGLGTIWEWTDGWFEGGPYKVVWKGKSGVRGERRVERDRASDVGFRCAMDAEDAEDGRR